ncbi:MAG: hypothetical protein EON95_08005, partial [Caulobacteraceae bacterium]
MSRLAVTRAAAPVLIGPVRVASSLQGAQGAAALANALLARYRLGGTWPADAELLVLTPPGPAPESAPTEPARSPDRPQPLHIRLSADIRLLRRLLAGRAAASVRSGPDRRDVARPAPRRTQPRQADRPARLEQPASGSTITRLSTSAAPDRSPGISQAYRTRTLSGSKSMSLLVIRIPEAAASPGPAAVMSVRAPAGSPIAAETPAQPASPTAGPAPLDVARAAAAIDRPALRTRATAAARARAADRTPKLVVRNRRGPGASLDRRTLAGRAAPQAARITPIIPRVSGPAAGLGAAAVLAGPDRVIPDRSTRSPGPPLDALAVRALAAQPANAAQPASARPAPTPGDQRRQALPLDVRRPP